MNQLPIHPAVRIGHVHLRVADLDRATAFYRDALGFPVTVYGPKVGVPLVLLAAGDYHHHIALNTFASAGGTPAPAGHTGLHHLALLYPDRAELSRAVRRLFEHDYPLDSAEDHGGPSRCTCATRMGMASSYTTTGRARIGSTRRVGQI